MTLTQLLTIMLMNPTHMGLSVRVLLECQKTATVVLVLLTMPTLDVSYSPSSTHSDGYGNLFFPSALKFDVGSATDADEANTVGYKDYVIDVYSNSWGPSDFGFVVSGPGPLLQNTLATGAVAVRKYSESQCCLLGVQAWSDHYKRHTLMILWN